MASGECFHEKEVDWRWRMQETRRDEAVEMRSLFACVLACLLAAVCLPGMAWFLCLAKVPCPSFLRLRPWWCERYLVLFSALQRCSESSG